VKRLAIIGACYAVFLSNSLLSLFFGATELTVTTSNRKQLLLENVDTLEKKRLQLTAKLEALRSDPESVIVEARALGFYRHGEEVIYLQNLKPSEITLEAGSALYLKPLESSNRESHKIIAIAVGLLTLFLFLANRNSRYAD